MSCIMAFPLYCLPGDFESSPVQQKKPRLERPERGQKTVSTAPPPPTAAAVAQPVLSSDQLKEGCRRLSRDERQFGKDVERALKDSAKENSNPPSEGSQRTVEDQKASADADSPPTGQDDSDFHPSEEEKEEDVLSGPDSSSDSDFDASPPPKKAAKTEGAAKSTAGKKTTTAITKTAAARKRAGAGADRKEVATAVAGKTTCNTVKTSKPTTAARTKSSTQTAAPFSSSPPTATVLPKSPLPGHHGTPGLGVRRMPKWTPPGQLSLD